MGKCADFRQEIEKDKMSYFIALKYDKNREKYVFDRRMQFTPLPVSQYAVEDPAASSVVSMVEYGHDKPLPQLGNYLVPDSTKNWSQTFDLHYDLTSMYAVQLDIGFLSPGSSEMANKIVKFCVVKREATMKQFLSSLASLMLIMQGKEIKDDFSSIVFALEDNGATMSRLVINLKRI